MKDIQGEDAVADLGIAHIIEFGTQDQYNYLIIDLLGTSLDLLMLTRGGKL